MTCSAPDCRSKADCIEVHVGNREMALVCEFHRTSEWRYHVPFRSSEEMNDYRIETRDFHLETM